MDESKEVDILVERFGVDKKAIEKCLKIVSRESGTSRKVVLQIMVDVVYSEFYEDYEMKYEDSGAHPFPLPTFEEFKAVVKEMEAMDLSIFDMFSLEYAKWIWLAKLNNKSLTLPELRDLTWGQENPSLDWVEKAFEQYEE